MGRAFPPAEHPSQIQSPFPSPWSLEYGSPFAFGTAVNSILWDLREAFRGLRKAPALVFICIFSLGLGVGVNLTLFSWLSAMFFDQPTIARPREVVGLEPGNSNQFSYLNYRDLKTAGIFESVFGSRRSALSLRTGDATQSVSGLAVTGNFFDGLGIGAQYGRVFNDAEAAPERDALVVVASHGFWRRTLDSNPSAVGRVLNLNGRPYTLLGVLPSDYRAVTPIESPDLYVPLNVLGSTNLSQRGNDSALTVMARLRPGMGIDQARSQLTAFGQRMEQAHPADNRGMKDVASVFPSTEIRQRGGPRDTPVLVALLMGLFGLVLLVACGNVAGLLMVRGAGRRQEIAVRFALGASRRRVVQSLLTEGLLLASIGTASALLLVFWLAPVMSAYGLPGLRGAHVDLQPDLTLVAYAAVVTLFTAIVCGITPAMRSTKGHITADIQKGGTRTATGHLKLRHTFVVAQVAISLLLLVVATLFLRSLLRIASTDPGFDVAHGVVVRVPASSVPPGQQVTVSEQIAGRLRTVAGVRSVSWAMLVPLGNDLRGERFAIEGRSETGARTLVNSVGPGYFETMRIPLLRGRDFAVNDRAGAQQVAIVSESFARAYFPGEEALGKLVITAPGETAAIIGIVRDHAYRNRGGIREPVLYRAYAQIPNMSTQPRPLIIHVRTDQLAEASLGTIRRAMAEMDPNGPAFVEGLRDSTSQEIVMRRVMGFVLSSVGALGLLLATIGLYGVMAFVVTSRTSEIAIQMALGASSHHVRWGVLGSGLKLVLIGVAIGTAVALAATRSLAAMLGGLSPSDPVAYVGTAIALTAVGLAASYFPARRATRVDPMAALRQQ
jgi:putative ABC transport system permease protein